MTVEFVGPMGLRPAHFQDKWIKNGRYRLPHPDKPGERLNALRASTFAKTISNNFTLNMWHQRKIVEGIATHQSLMLEAAEELAKFRYTMRQLDTEPNGYSEEELAKLKAEIGFEHRKKIQKIASRAADAASAKEPASRGTYLHGLTVLYDKGENPGLPRPWDRDLVAYHAILTKMGIQCAPEFTEKSIWNRELNIAGTFDRLVRYIRHTDKWVVLDLKTGRDLQYGWAEIPIQLWCYAMGDVLCDPQNFRGWDPMPQTCADLGLVLHLPEGQGRATLFEVDLATKIEIEPMARPADLAIAVQKWRNTRRLAKPVAHIEITEHGEVVDTPLSWDEQMLLATSEAELEEIAKEAVAAGAWKASVTRRKNIQLLTLQS